MSQKGATTIRPLSAHAAETVQTAHGSLLVVDDQEINRDMLSRRLERRGYTVAAAGDGCQAMEMITTQNLDLVLLAIMMSRISGLEVLKILCA